MNLSLFLVGTGKLLFGLLVAVLGMFLAFRLLRRVLHGSTTAAANNLAEGVLEAGALVALGILAQNTVSATFSALDLLLHRGASSAQWVKLALAALAHVGFTLLVGSLLLAVGIWFFNRLTPELDEVEEVRKGSTSAALLLAAILVVMALLTAPGLEAALDGLIPYPDLPKGVIVPPT